MAWCAPAGEARPLSVAPSAVTAVAELFQSTVPLACIEPVCANTPSLQVRMAWHGTHARSRDSAIVLILQQCLRTACADIECSTLIDTIYANACFAMRSSCFATDGSSREVSTATRAHARMHTCARKHIYVQLPAREVLDMQLRLAGCSISTLVRISTHVRASCAPARMCAHTRTCAHTRMHPHTCPRTSTSASTIGEQVPLTLPFTSSSCGSFSDKICAVSTSPPCAVDCMHICAGPCLCPRLC